MTTGTELLQDDSTESKTSLNSASLIISNAIHVATTDLKPDRHPSKTTEESRVAYIIALSHSYQKRVRHNYWREGFKVISEF